MQSYSHVQGAAVFDALSYYLDHQTEIEQEISANRLDVVMKKHELAKDECGALGFQGRLRRRRLSMAQDTSRLFVSLYQFGELLRRVLRLLNRWTADELDNQIVFLQQFK